MAVIGEELEGYVQSQIKARQVLHGSGVGHTGVNRTGKQINLLNSNTSWIKLASGVSVSEARLTDINLPTNLNGMELAKNNILFSGLSKLKTQSVEGNSYTQLEQREGFLPRDDNSSYTYGSFGFSPMPGIISADIKTLTRGSLKKATVKLTANNKQQFDIIDLLYMRLGYTVLLEWGNSIYTTNGFNKEILRNTLIEETFFPSKGSDSYFTFLQDIEEKRNKYNGNYDALLGKVSNFNWSFNEDGSYSIELTIISLGDVIESLKSNLSVSKGINEFLQSINPNPSDPQTPSPVNEEESSADTITAMLTTWKFINNNKTSIPSDNLGVQIQNSKKENFVIGSLLSTEQTGNGEDIISTQVDYTLTKTLKIRVDSDGLKGEGTYQAIQKFSINANAAGWDDAYKKIIEFNKSILTLTYDQIITGGIVGELTITPIIKLKVTQEPISTYGNAAENFINLFADAGPNIDVTDSPNKYAGLAEIIRSIPLNKKVISQNYTITNPLSNFTGNDAFKLLTKEPEYYIRFGALLEYIKNNIIIKIDNVNKDPIFDIDVDEWSTHMYSLPNQISLDPRVCLVRNSIFDTGLNGITNIFGTGQVLQIFKEADNGESKNDNAAYPLNIYLNFNFVQECLTADDKGNVSVYELISKICTGLNKALGGINNLEPIIDETSNILRIIDTTPIPGYSAATNGPGYKLQIYGYDKLDNRYISNFVRKVDLKTVIDPGFATMITVGATAGGYIKGTEATAFSKWNVGLTDRFKENFLPTPNTSTTDINEPAIDYKDIFLDKGFSSRYGLNFLGANMSFSNNIIEKNISVVTEYYKWLIAENAKGQISSGGTVGFIPFKLGLTLDGISGIKIYNVLRINTEFLPKAYGESVDLIVTGVSHGLSNNDWETSIEATVMPKTGKAALVTITAEEAATSIQNEVNNIASKESYQPTSADDDLWVYLSWQQGTSGASQHYQVSTGKRKTYGIAPEFIKKNWPGNLQASNKVSKVNIDTLYKTDPKKLAIGFIDVWRQRYNTATSRALTLINSSGKNRTGVLYSDIKKAFQKYALPNKGLTWEKLARFGLIENSLNTDDKTATTFQGMFQINKTYDTDPNYVKILANSKKGIGHKPTYTEYDLDKYVEPLVIRIANKLKDFKNMSGYPN